MKPIVVNLPIEPVHMWVLFLLVLLFFIIISIMLIFHWTYYGVNENPRVFAKGLYFTIAVILLFLALIFISLYSAT